MPITPGSYPRATATSTATTQEFEGRTPAEVRADLNVEDGATANLSDAALVARANHTGSQPISTLSDINTGDNLLMTAAERVAVAAALVDGDFGSNGFMRRTGAGSYSISAQINADTEITGTVPAANLGSGSPDGTTFLRGDGVWAVPPGGGGGIANVFADPAPRLGGNLETSGRALVGRFENATGATLTAGSAVSFDSAGSSFANAVLSDADDNAVGPCVGIVAADIANGADGLVVQWGEMPLDTTGMSEGDPLYVSATAGGLTTTPPATGDQQQVAYVLTVGASGAIFVDITQPGLPLRDGTVVPDANGNSAYGFSIDPSAEEYLVLANAALGFTPRLTVDGTSANIDLFLEGKGTGCALIPKLSIVTLPGTAETLAANHAGRKLQTSNGAAVTLTIPAGLDPDGGFVCVATQNGAGALTIAGGAGVTVNGVLTGSETIASQWQGATLNHLGGDEWHVFGALS